MVATMDRPRTAFWGWTESQWAEALTDSDYRHYVMAFAYLLCDRAPIRDPATPLRLYAFARKIFGPEPVEAARQQVHDELLRWGWARTGILQHLYAVLAEILLASRSPLLADIHPAALDRLRASGLPPSARSLADLITRALVSLGVSVARLCRPHRPAVATKRQGTPDRGAPRLLPRLPGMG